MTRFRYCHDDSIIADVYLGSLALSLFMDLCDQGVEFYTEEIGDGDD